MPTLLHFLQNAHFPAPSTVIKETANTTDVSDLDIGLVEDAWKASLAIRDNALVNNLSDTLAQILGQHNDSEAKVSHDPSRRPCLIVQPQAVQLLNIGINMAVKYSRTRSLRYHAKSRNVRAGVVPRSTWPFSSTTPVASFWRRNLLQ